MYMVQVNDPPAVYRSGYFPRKFRLLRDAKACAQAAIDAGATHARVEYPASQGGVELDFWPKATLAKYGVHKEGN